MSNKMEAGELELRKVFEETTTRNVKSILEHGNETRKLVRDLEEKIRKQDLLIIEQNKQIQTFKLQLVSLQMEIYKGGT